MVEIDFTGVGIAVKMSPVQEYEARHRGVAATDADIEIRRLMTDAVKARFPGAAVEVATEGDAPSADVTNVGEYRIAQAMKYDIQRLGLKLKWDFSTGGLGLRESYVGPIWG